MKAQELDTKPAKSAWFAAKDADRYSDDCRITYTAKQRATAETFKDLVEYAYSGRVYLTYRKTFVSVKIDQPVVRDRKFKKSLEELCTERGYQKISTAQGITYRIPQ